MTWLNITSPLITFVKLSLPQVENLPKDAEATTDVIFSIFTAAALSCVKPASAVDDRSKPEDFTFPPKWVTFPTNVTLRLFEVLRIFDQSLDPNVVSDFFRLQEEYDMGEENQTWRSMKDWLDKKKKGSVVYIAFGSEAKPSQVELTEIALGLELSGLPFIWVLRKHRGSVDTESIELPEGFEKRTRAQDLGINARVLEEKKMGYSIPRNEKSGYFTRDSVAESLRLVMEMEEGKVYRDKAKEMRPLFADKDQQDKYVEKLLDHLRSHGRIKKIKR
ncbi:hypothetical protein OIU77_005587 [Salix suchowensis]|uniref:Uncharacterized protein n=1 Tax=Salix suchowensis TaxID=1278906 RepID=A0ABQ9APZ8_9ROSI|nr:hypothetical protein OIU77_005587 [Salix suchowensis]